MEEESVKIEDILDAIKERWQLVICITLILTILAAAASFFVIKPKYSAKAKLFIGKGNETNKSDYSSNDVQMYQKLLKTYADIITTRDLVGSALDSYGLEKNKDAVLAGLVVTPQTDTQILSISYTDQDKKQCKDVVDAVSNEFVKQSKELISNSNVKIIEKVALPNKPVSPNKKLNILVAFLIGLLLGSGVAIIIKFMDNTFRDKEQVEKVLNLPVLGSIPNSEIVK